MDKVFLGQRLGKFEPGLEHLPISRVDLLDENGDLLHTAGDDTGRTLEAVHPDATQEMAESILASVRGFTYRPYEAQEAFLDPAAELGDGITLNGVYSLLAHASTDYDALCLSDLEAPASDEIDEEYPYKDPLERLIQRNIQSVRSFITKTATEIKLSVEDVQKALGTTLRVGLDGVTITDADGNTVTIDGKQVDAATINASQINASDLRLSGVLTWADFGSDAQDELLEETTQAAKDDITKTVVPDLDARIQASRERADSAYDLAWDAESLANNAVDVAGDAYALAEETSDEFASVKKVSGGKTYIDGAKVYSQSIYADAMHLGGSLTIYSSKTGTTIGGYLGYTTSANDGSAGMHMKKGSGEVVVTGNGAKLTYNGSVSQVAVSAGGVGLVSNGTTYYVGVDSFYNASDCDLGSSLNPWGQIYANNSTISTSDANKKHDIEDLDARYVLLFDNLILRRFKFNNGTSNRYHPGFISQEVETALKLSGLDTQEFGGFVKDADKNGNDLYFLRYEEFIPILAAKIKQLERRMKGDAA